MKFTETPDDDSQMPKTSVSGFALAAAAPGLKVPLLPPSEHVWWPVGQHVLHLLRLPQFSELITHVSILNTTSLDFVFVAGSVEAAMNRVNDRQEADPQLALSALPGLNERLEVIPTATGLQLMRQMTIQCYAFSAAGVEAVMAALAMEVGVGSDLTPQCGIVSVSSVEICHPSVSALMMNKLMPARRVEVALPEQGKPSLLDVRHSATSAPTEVLEAAAAALAASKDKHLSKEQEMAELQSALVTAARVEEKSKRQQEDDAAPAPTSEAQAANAAAGKPSAQPAQQGKPTGAAAAPSQADLVPGEPVQGVHVRAPSDLLPTGASLSPLDTAEAQAKGVPTPLQTSPSALHDDIKYKEQRLAREQAQAAESFEASPRAEARGGAPFIEKEEPLGAKRARTASLDAKDDLTYKGVTQITALALAPEVAREAAETHEASHPPTIGDHKDGPTKPSPHPFDHIQHLPAGPIKDQTSGEWKYEPRANVADLAQTAEAFSRMQGKGPTTNKLASSSTFADSVQSRVLVGKLLAQITQGAVFSFDYMMLVFAAALLAGVGLATDNVVVIVASMLVSALMGPILGMTFGTFIADPALIVQGLVSEALGFLLCILGGVIVAAISSRYAGEGDLDWPTEQMEIRGDPFGLVLGIAIAIPSGLGVGLSVTGNNTASLVGVAISASLLPPLVNAGMCWYYAAVGYLYVRTDPSLTPGEFAVLGGYSFALTIINIILVWMFALLVFYIKEAAPIRGKSFLFQTVTRQLRHMPERPTDMVMRRKLQNEAQFETGKGAHPVGRKGFGYGPDGRVPTEGDPGLMSTDAVIGLDRALQLFRDLKSGVNVVNFDDVSASRWRHRAGSDEADADFRRAEARGSHLTFAGHSLSAKRMHHSSSEEGNNSDGDSKPLSPTGSVASGGAAADAAPPSNPPLKAASSVPVVGVAAPAAASRPKSRPSSGKSAVLRGHKTMDSNSGRAFHLRFSSTVDSAPIEEAEAEDETPAPGSDGEEEKAKPATAGASAPAPAAAAGGKAVRKTSSEEAKDKSAEGAPAPISAAQEKEKAADKGPGVTAVASKKDPPRTRLGAMDLEAWARSTPAATATPELTPRERTATGSSFTLPAVDAAPASTAAAPVPAPAAKPPSAPEAVLPAATSPPRADSGTGLATAESGEYRVSTDSGAALSRSFSSPRLLRVLEAGAAAQARDPRLRSSVPLRRSQSTARSSGIARQAHSSPGDARHRRNASHPPRMMLEVDADGFSFGSLLGGGTVGAELSRHMSRMNSLFERELQDEADEEASQQ